MIDYLSLLSKHTQGEHHQTVPALIIHSALVTKKALDIAEDYLRRNPDVELDLRFIEEAGMLHDIGIFETQTDVLFTNGSGSYATHITHGERLLREEGFDKHARAARNHQAMPREVVLSRDLDLPVDDYVPQSPEEEVIALADFFYSKRFASLFEERSVEEVREHVVDSTLSEFERLYAKYCE